MCKKVRYYGPVAQLERASAYEAEGRAFESLQDHYTRNSIGRVPRFRTRLLKVRVLLGVVYERLARSVERDGA